MSLIYQDSNFTELSTFFYIKEHAVEEVYNNPDNCYFISLFKF